MKLIATMAGVAAFAGSLAGASAALKVVVSAPGHAPSVNTHWNYAVRATQNGKPVGGKLTEQIVDPIGGKHPVEFGTSTKPITNWQFKGMFRDFIIWPASSRGVPLKFRVIVVVGKTRRVVDYAVTPRT